MEKKIVKTGVYSFILSLLLGLLLFKEGHTYSEGSGFVSVVYDNTMQYILKLLRFSAIATLLAVIIAALDKKNLLVTNNNNELSYVKIICVVICISLAAYWLVIKVYTL